VKVVSMKSLLDGCAGAAKYERLVALFASALASRYRCDPERAVDVAKLLLELGCGLESDLAVSALEDWRAQPSVWRRELAALEQVQATAWETADILAMFAVHNSHCVEMFREIGAAQVTN
jgi:hypothetical protein